MKLKDRLLLAIKKFEDNTYSLSDFHSVVESIIQSITEDHNSELRTKLDELESELEYIDFMVNTPLRKKEYQSKINEFSVWLAQYNSPNDANM